MKYTWGMISCGFWILGKLKDRCPNFRPSRGIIIFVCPRFKRIRINEFSGCSDSHSNCIGLCTPSPYISIPLFRNSGRTKKPCVGIHNCYIGNYPDLVMSKLLNLPIEYDFLIHDFI